MSGKIPEKPGGNFQFVAEPQQQLNVPVRRVDRPGMIDLELELVTENPSWIAVLKAYQQAQEELALLQAAAVAQSAKLEKSLLDSEPSTALEGANANRAAAESHANGSVEGDSDDAADGVDNDATGAKKRASRWVQRITGLSGIESAELSKIHGCLIAYDLLKCDLAGRSDGMVYQLSSSGRMILSRFGDERPEAEERSAA